MPLKIKISSLDFFMKEIGQPKSVQCFGFGICKWNLVWGLVRRSAGTEVDAPIIWGSAAASKDDYGFPIKLL